MQLLVSRKSANSCFPPIFVCQKGITGITVLFDPHFGGISMPKCYDIGALLRCKVRAAGGIPGSGVTCAGSARDVDFP